LIDSKEQASREVSLVINFNKPPKNIPDNLYPININEIPPITDYAKNIQKDMTLGYRIGDSKELTCEQNFLLIWASSFPIDTAKISKLIKQKAQTIFTQNESSIQKTLYRNLNLDNINQQDTEDFTMQIFDDNTKSLAYRQGKDIVSVYPIQHYIENQKSQKGHYAFAKLEPNKICSRIENPTLYLTFENNNLYTPVKMYVYTVGLKSEKPI